MSGEIRGGAKWRRVILAFGANLGDRAANITGGAHALVAGGALRLVALSPLRETAPWGFAAQPDFLNAAGAFLTRLSPLRLLDVCQSAENAFGRARTIPNGPRTLDIDLLFFEGVTLETPRLTLPHPRWRERTFVTDPLRDLLATPPVAADPRWAALIGAPL